MTDEKERWEQLSEAEQRAAKFEQLAEVMELSFDLLNDDVSADAWHESLARLASCRTVACLWWREGSPQNFLHEGVGQLQPAPDEWVDYLEPALSAARPDGPTMLEAISSNPKLLTPDRMVYCLESTAVRIVFIFADPLHSDAWTDSDREHVLRVMKLIAKPVKTKRRLSWLEDVLDLTNQFLDGLPRACITLTPDAEIIATNFMARNVLQQGELMRTRNNRLEFVDRAKDEELHHELATLLKLPKAKLASYAWHRNLSDSAGADGCMLAMHAFPFENWRLESSARDRVAIIVMQLHDQVAIPSTNQLKEFYKLTSAQARVARALMEGLKVEEVADHLNISINTVRTHLRAIYSRLGVESKTELMARLSKTLSVPKGDSHA